MKASLTEVEVGPVGNSYFYRINGHLSQHNYHNSASARADGLREQRILDNGRIEPIPE